MNEELIKRIDEWLAEILPDDLAELLQDCRAALTEMPRAVAYVDNSSLEELKRELCSGIMVGSFSERYNRTKPLYEAPHDTAALSRSSSETSSRYVPMTDDEAEFLDKVSANAEKAIYTEQGVIKPKQFARLRTIEVAVIRRAGLEVVCKQTENQK